ncbi:MAG: winged helix-turn-helix domain-containing protein [Pseudonocardiales bacterium]|nr:winged helix-turn-helix domain-containing protein [Pseudonocardiales bacterium]
MSQPDIPPYSDLLWPTIVAVRRLGGSGSIDGIAEAVVVQEGFTEVQQQVLHGDGPQTEIEYRPAWARSYLKGLGLLVNSKRADHQDQQERRPASLGRLVLPRPRRQRRLTRPPHLQRGCAPRRGEVVDASAFSITGDHFDPALA